MLVVHQSLGTESAGLSFDCAIGRSAGLYLVRLYGVVWDTRFLPRAERDRSSWCLIAVLMRGAVAIEPGNLRIAPGCCAILSEGHLVPSGPGGIVVRAGGETTEAVALRVPASALEFDVREPMVRELGSAIRTELAAFADAMSGRKVATGWSERVAAAIAACVREGILSPDASLDERELSADLRRASDTLFPILQELSKSPMLIDLVERAGVTPRQMLRDILKLQSEYDFPDRGWRDLLARWRLTMAVLLLSAEDMTPMRVASEVGYGSVTAMGRAFRDQGIPSPREVQRQFRDLER